MPVPTVSLVLVTITCHTNTKQLKFTKCRHAFVMTTIRYTRREHLLYVLRFQLREFSSVSRRTSKKDILFTGTYLHIMAIIAVMAVYEDNEPRL